MFRDCSFIYGPLASPIAQRDAVVLEDAGGNDCWACTFSKIPLE
jgi:hypothetical protein